MHPSSTDFTKFLLHSAFLSLCLQWDVIPMGFRTNKRPQAPNASGLLLKWNRLQKKLSRELMASTIAHYKDLARKSGLVNNNFIFNNSDFNHLDRKSKKLARLSNRGRQTCLDSLRSEVTNFHLTLLLGSPKKIVAVAHTRGDCKV